MNKVGKLADPNFEYVKSEMSREPGYLNDRMKIYKEMVRRESAGGSRKVRPREETASNEQTSRGVLLDFTALREPVTTNVKKNRG